MKGGAMRNEEFEKIYRLYYRPLMFYALSLVKQKADAEDLVAETMVRAFLSYDGKSDLRAWLFHVLKNLFIDETRKKKRVVYSEKELLESFADPKSFIQRWIFEEDRRWLYQQIYLLPDLERNVMLLTLTSGLKDDQIAAQLNIKSEYLRVIRNRTKNKLKEIARKEGQDGRE